MTRLLNALVYVLIIAAVCASLACSGGSGNTVAGGGIGGTGVTSSGEITDFGSIWVNGVEFDTQQAEIYINNISLGSGDQTVNENLDIGRIVCIKGRAYDTESGLAEKVYYTSTVTGPIEAIDIIDAYTRQLTVLGQGVLVDDRTWLKDVGMDSFVVGNFVDVSGLFDGTGNIVGSFLAKTADDAPPNSVFNVSGPVSNLEADTLSINNLTVDYSQAVVSGFSPSGLENGIFVSISGRFDISDPSTFIAETVQPYRLLGELQDGDNVEFAGYVFDQPSANRFHINGYLTEINSNTEYTGGTAADILPGSKIKVHGYFSSGMIVAQQILLSASMRAESNLGQKDGMALTLELIGMEGFTIRTNSLTRYNGLVDSFANLTPGDHLLVTGHIVDDQTAVASRIIGLPAAPGLERIELRGTVTAISDPVLTINSVQIDTDLIPPGGFHAYNNAPISQEAFFTMVGEDDPVEAKGDLLADDSVSWQSISLIRLQ
jgi:hypothetical protein